jgi:bifunctional DNA-binding transcriptional regulator/antitoxin component of YhaV-PrlF toxin-antitoxin module
MSAPFGLVKRAEVPSIPRTRLSAASFAPSPASCPFRFCSLFSTVVFGYFHFVTTTVGESNQVKIPPEIVREFGIRPGTQLEWTKGGEGVISLKPLPSRGELARKLMGAGRHLLKPGADPIADLIRDRERDDQLDRRDDRQ